MNKIQNLSKVELRAHYRKMRNKIHKELKAFYLAGGRFVDGWKNAQLAASQGKEERLMSIKKHYENLEKERIAKLQEERAKLLEPYDLSVIPENLGEVEPDVWENYLKGVKSNYEIRVQAEKKAEEERLEAERIEALRWKRADIIKPYYSFFEEPTDGRHLGHYSDEEFEALHADLKAKKEADDNER